VTRNDIIILAAYWNESELIEPSLAQIDAIDPIEVIISEGNFDPTVERPSDDGTREAIENFVDERDNAKMVSAKRPSRLKGVLEIAKGHSQSRLDDLLSIPKWVATYASCKTAAYRLNQAVTFNYMASISDKWEPGKWVMTYDADQFYSDDMINNFSITNSETDIGLLTGTELTFFNSFREYTPDYETRSYSNMPHKIYSDTFIRPTRGICLAGQTRNDESVSDKIYNHHYVDHNIKTKHIGEYHHYKIPDIDPERFQEGYKLGDRKKPDLDNYEMKEFAGDYPDVITEHFDLI
jgi:hypothetical protein